MKTNCKKLGKAFLSDLKEYSFSVSEEIERNTTFLITTFLSIDCCFSIIIILNSIGYFFMLRFTESLHLLIVCLFFSGQSSCPWSNSFVAAHCPDIYELTCKKLFCSSFHFLSRTVGCNLFKRLAINALLAIASLFTKEKVLQRVLFATMDDVLKEVNEVRSNG